MLNASEILRLLESTDLHEVLEDLCSEVYDDLREDIKTGLLDSAKGLLKHIKDSQMSQTEFQNLRSYQKERLTGINFLQTSAIPGSPRMEWEAAKLRPDAEEMADKYATKGATQILSDFREKVISKLEKISANVGRPKVEILSHHRRSGNFEADLKFVFGKASFRVRTQVVGVWTDTKMFARFPLTFHDVVLSDGTSMKTPSEKKMIAEFK